jgi:hypothetical protein
MYIAMKNFKVPDGLCPNTFDFSWHLKLRLSSHRLITDKVHQNIEADETQVVFADPSSPRVVNHDIESHKLSWSNNGHELNRGYFSPLYLLKHGGLTRRPLGDWPRGEPIKLLTRRKKKKIFLTFMLFRSVMLRNT